MTAKGMENNYTSPVVRSRGAKAITRAGWPVAQSRLDGAVICDQASFEWTVPLEVSPSRPGHVPSSNIV